jgi:SARP family transcriptional regulator, regulator of embCAB operon
MEFRILGLLWVSDGGGPNDVPAVKQRALLAILLLGANEPVPADRLIDRLWGGQPPSSARKVLPTYVSGLISSISTGSSGWWPEAREAGPGEAAELLHRALGMWRGSSLADLRDEPFAQAEIAWLEELRLAVVEERVEADLALGRHTLLVAELRALVAEYPWTSRSASST